MCMLKLLCNKKKKNITDDISYVYCGAFIKKPDTQCLAGVRSIYYVVLCCNTCIGVCMVAMGWSIEVKAEMADMRTSSLTSTLPWTRVCVRGDGGTVM